MESSKEREATLEELIAEIQQPLWRSAARSRLAEIRAENDRLWAIIGEIGHWVGKARPEFMPTKTSRTP